MSTIWMDRQHQGAAFGGNRTLHLVDIENLMGDAHRRVELTAEAFRRFLRAASWQEGDHVFVAGQPGHLAAIGFDPIVPHRGMVAYRGPDGADRRLTELDTVDHIGARFGKVVIGSGDHHFVELTAGLAANGVEVVVVSLRTGLSRLLGAAAGDRRFVQPFVPGEDYVIDLTDRGPEDPPRPVLAGRPRRPGPGRGPARRARTGELDASAGATTRSSGGRRSRP